MRKQLISLAMTAVVFAGGVGVAHADGAPAAPTAGDVTSAIEQAAPAVAADTTDAAVHTDADSAEVTTTAGSTVDIPKDPSAPIVLDTPSAPPVTITIEGADSAHDAKRTSDGTVVYQGTAEQASTAVQPTDDGGVRFLTVISGPDAPRDYRFDMTLSEGSQIIPTGDGGYAVVSADGTPTHVIYAPWAKDANGAAVPVSYSLDGTTIVMHVDHIGAAYPVVADPWTTIFKPWKWNKHIYNCILWGGVGAAGTVISGGTAAPAVAVAGLGCFAGAASR